MSNDLALESYKATILIVDDTPNNLKRLFNYLKDACYKILVAQSGKRALKVANSVHLDLILLDVMMPVIDGFETCIQLKHNSNTRDIPVIFMTALGETKNKVKGFEVGAVDYLTKPIDRQELLARIKTHITVQNLRRRSVEEQTRKLLFDLNESIRKSLDLNLIFRSATEEIIKVLQCDRLALARLSNEKIIIESQSSINSEIGKLPQLIEFNYFGFDRKNRQYSQQGEVQAINNIESETEGIRAQLIVPILLKDNTPKANIFYPLWGYLIVEQCSDRKWQPEEIELCQNISIQLAIAINQGLLYRQLKQSNQLLQISNKRLNETNQELRQLALLDPLTKVFNRRYFDRQLDLEWRKIRRNSSVFLSLIICDVDCFKIYNDTYGHQKGDECLEKIVDALSKVIQRPADILARYGGEEFVILLPDTPQAGAIKLAESMRVAVQSSNIPHANSTVDSVVTISLGVANAIPSAKNTPEFLIEAADQALYEAKKRGRNCLAIYQGDVSQSKQSRNTETQWVNRIRHAIEKNLFRLYAQPIASLGSNKQQQRFEILIRLADEKDGVIAPNAFLDIAARNFLMPDIDKWVINNLLEKLKEFGSKNWHDYQFSINLSGASLNSKPFLNFLLQKLKSYHLPARIFCFEITETEAISNLNSVSNFINSLKTLGCSFALDDFGKGFSSLSYLKNLPVDYLKIDGSFITELNKDKASMVMVEAIHHIAEGIGLETVAEFVEDRDILDTVRKLNVDYAQGYHFGCPEEFSKVLAGALPKDEILTGD